MVGAEGAGGAERHGVFLQRAADLRREMMSNIDKLAKCQDTMSEIGANLALLEADMNSLYDTNTWQELQELTGICRASSGSPATAAGTLSKVTKCITKHRDEE